MIGAGGAILLITMSLPHYKHWHQKQVGSH